MYENLIIELIAYSILLVIPNSLFVPLAESKNNEFTNENILKSASLFSVCTRLPVDNGNLKNLNNSVRLPSSRISRSPHVSLL